MKRHRFFRSVVLLVILAGFAGPFLVQSPPAWAAAPQMINYQGRLKESGVPVTGTYPMVFRIFDAASAGTLLYQSGSELDPAVSVQIANGLFTYVLGGPTDTNPHYQLSAIDWESKECYLEITVNGTTLSPRERLISVPYAMNARKLAGMESSSFATLSGSQAMSNKTISASTIDVSSNTITNLGNASIASDAAIDKGKISSTGAWSASEIPNLDASKVASGSFDTARITDKAVTAAKLADDAARANILRAVACEDSLAVGEAVYYDAAAGKYKRARANATTTMPAVGMVLTAASGTPGSMACDILLSGKITGLSGLIAGTGYYVSKDTAGAITATKPSASGEYAQQVGVADGTTSLIFNVSARAYEPAVGPEPGLHASSHAASGADKISYDNLEDGTTYKKILDTERTKLAGIEEHADVTDAENVTAAGAVMDGDFTANGLMKRAGAGSYAAIDDNSANWTAAYGWGNHASAGYFVKASDTLDAVNDGTTYKRMLETERTKLTGIEELADVTDAENVTAAGAVMDGDFTANGLMKRTGVGSYAAVDDNSANWTAAYGWGNHASAGYFVKASDTLDAVNDGTTYGKTTAADRDALHAWLAAPHQTVYVDGARTDSYTPDGTFAKPFKTIKSALAAITDASSSKRYCVKVATAVYNEDNPITWKNYVYMTGDFKHNPNVKPLHNDQNLIEYPSGYTTCDFGELTFTAPTNGAILYSGDGCLPITGLYYCLFIGSGANSVGVHIEEDNSGYHTVNCMMYGTFNVFTDCQAGNWRDTGMRVHAGTVMNYYLKAGGSNQNYILDNFLNESTAINTLIYGNNATANIVVSGVVSSAIPTLAHLDNGSMTITNSQCNGKVQVDGGNATLDGLNDTYAGNVVTLGTTGVVNIRNSALTSTGANDTITFSASPSAMSMSNCQLTGGGSYNISSNAARSINMMNLLMDDGCDSHIVNATTPHVHEVPQIYKTISTAISAATENDIVLVAAGSYTDKLTLLNKGLVFYGVNGAVNVTPPSGGTALDIDSTENVLHSINFYDFNFYQAAYGAPIIDIDSSSTYYLLVSLTRCLVYIGDEATSADATSIANSATGITYLSGVDTFFGTDTADIDLVHYEGAGSNTTNLFLLSKGSQCDGTIRMDNARFVAIDSTLSGVVLNQGSAVTCNIINCTVGLTTISSNLITLNMTKNLSSGITFTCEASEDKVTLAGNRFNSGGTYDITATAAGDTVAADGNYYTNGIQWGVAHGIYISGNDRYSVPPAQIRATIAANDTTPSVQWGDVFVTSANTGATAITDLDEPPVGKTIRIMCGSMTNASTIADSGNFKLNGAWNPAAVGDNITLFIYADNDYREVGRSMN